MKVLFVVILFLVTLWTAAAQATNIHVSEGMRALNFLVGKWQGKVIYDEPASDRPQEVFWTVHVHYSVGGNILIVDEKGSHKEIRNKTIREVFVVIYWDSAAKVYPTRLYFPRKGGGSSTEAKSLVLDNKLIVLNNRQSTIYRYTVRLNEKGQWYEVGEVSKDGGKIWKRTFVMTLNRQV